MRTLSFEQMEQINGGWPQWLVDAVNAVGNFFSDVWDWIVSHGYPLIEQDIDGDWWIGIGFEF